jgi:hypothetical protein
MPEAIKAVEPVLGTGKAVEHLVATFPSKERACVLLKDLFDSLEEIAELVDSAVGGVKGALNRARTKLAVSAPSAKWSVSPELKQIMRLYVHRFNRRDWEKVRELTSADARLWKHWTMRSGQSNLKKCLRLLHGKRTHFASELLRYLDGVGRILKQQAPLQCLPHRRL